MKSGDWVEGIYGGLKFLGVIERFYYFNTVLVRILEMQNEVDMVDIELVMSPRRIRKVI